MHATIPKGNMGYDPYTVAVELTFDKSMASRAILANFFEEQ